MAPNAKLRNMALNGKNRTFIHPLRLLLCYVDRDKGSVSRVFGLCLRCGGNAMRQGKLLFGINQPQSPAYCPEMVNRFTRKWASMVQLVKLEGGPALKIDLMRFTPPGIPILKDTLHEDHVIEICIRDFSHEFLGEMFLPRSYTLEDDDYRIPDSLFCLLFQGLPEIERMKPSPHKVSECMKEVRRLWRLKHLPPPQCVLQPKKRPWLSKMEKETVETLMELAS